MVLYFFYKNMLFTIPQYVFAFVNGYSGMSAFEDFAISGYNLFFTSGPLVMTATFDWDIV